MTSVSRQDQKTYYRTVQRIQ